MVIDGDDAGANVIAAVARRLLINPCPGFAVGVRTMVLVTIQVAPEPGTVILPLFTNRNIRGVPILLKSSYDHHDSSGGTDQRA